MSSVKHDRRDFFPAAGHDLFLPLYDPFVRLMGFDRTRRELISQANIEPTHHLLDIGCGTGTFVVLLKRQYATAQVVGLDPDPNALRRARSKVGRAGVSVQLDQGFSDQLPYKEKSFDRVFSSFMFHHLEQREREGTLKEALRVLKPGGSFHLLDFVADHDSDRFLDRLIRGHALMKDNDHKRIIELMSRMGFTNVARVKESRMFFGLFRAAYFRATVLMGRGE